MEHLEHIAVEGFAPDIFTLFDQGWFLLTAGEFASGRFNTMTVGWGFMGTMWARPVVMAVVRPQRYTMEFINNYDSFTLSALPVDFRPALALLGRESGRDGDKIAKAGLTPIAASTVSAPTFAEAELVIECRKQTVGRFRAPDFVNKKLIRDFYPERDFHQMVTGAVAAVHGAEKYRRK